MAPSLPLLLWDPSFILFKLNPVLSILSHSNLPNSQELLFFYPFFSLIVSLGHMFLFFIYFYFMHMCTGISPCTYVSGILGARESAGSPGTGVTGLVSCHVGPRNQTQVLRSVVCSFFLKSESFCAREVSKWSQWLFSLDCMQTPGREMTSSTHLSLTHTRIIQTEVS